VRQNAAEPAVIVSGAAIFRAYLLLSYCFPGGEQLTTYQIIDMP
jgi:hypothetical protein